MRLTDLLPRSLGAALLAGLATFVLTQPAAAQGSYDECGQIVQGVTCQKLFRDDNGSLWLLEDFGSFVVGDRVRVQGTPDPGCFSICNQGNGCIYNNTIGTCDPAGTPFCFGDGTGTPCPCGNLGAAGQGCANSTGAGAQIATSGSDSVSADDLGVDAVNLPAGVPSLLFGGNNAVNGGLGVAFGDGLRCVGGGVQRLGVRTAGAGGTASWGPGLASQGGYVNGQTVRLQVWYRNPVGSPCGFEFNASNGLEVTFDA